MTDSLFCPIDTKEYKLSKELTIQNKKGLHARAAAAFVRTASGFDADVIVEKSGNCVNASSIMGLMMLAASLGTKIIIKAKGPEAEAALNAIEELVNNKFGED